MIKVLVVDDAPFMRMIFKQVIEKDSELKVISHAENGQIALEKIKEIKPDVITLDIDMPVKNGLETLRDIMSFPEPIPCIMVSALDDKETVLKALDLGAFDFIAKPSKPHTSNIEEIKDKLIKQIKAAASVQNATKDIEPIITFDEDNLLKISDKYPIIAIGSSSGGPRALNKILPVFPANFPAAIVIVQHMPRGFTNSLAKRLNQESAITVKEASQNDRLKPGQALIAPGGFHLEINDKETVNLNKTPPIHSVRPAVDIMMTSLAQNFKDRVIGVILTGMGTDGAEGMKIIKENKGYGIIEDRSTAMVYGMPQAVEKAGAYDEIAPIHQIPSRLIKVIERCF